MPKQLILESITIGSYIDIASPYHQVKGKAVYVSQYSLDRQKHLKHEAEQYAKSLVNLRRNAPKWLKKGLWAILWCYVRLLGKAWELGNWSRKF